MSNVIHIDSRILLKRGVKLTPVFNGEMDDVYDELKSNDPDYWNIDFKLTVVLVIDIPGNEFHPEQVCTVVDGNIAIRYGKNHTLLRNLAFYCDDNGINFSIK